ncbi:MAG: hypothetical protein IJ383_00050 [Bacteroidales bacterium]|nr:hypothetical protein [Bacteroidales bacterium]
MIKSRRKATISKPWSPTALKAYMKNKESFELNKCVREMTIMSMAASMGKSKGDFIIYLLDMFLASDPEMKKRYNRFYDENLKILEAETAHANSINEERECGNNQESDL